MSKKTRANDHFTQRVRQRIGEDVNATRLSRKIRASIRDDDGFVRFKAKVQGGKYLYRFRFLSEEYAVVVVFENGLAVPITVYTNSMYVWTRKGKYKRACGRVPYE